jgi:hypothetical protein
MSPHQEALSEVQKSKSRTCFIDFDFDVEVSEGSYREVIGKTLQFVNREAVTVLSTRGGFHCLIDPSKVEKQFVKGFYQGLKSVAGVDQTGDQMIPVPGCTQGMYTPHFLNIM